MEVTISARHFELTEEIKDHINKELGKLKKYFDNVMNVRVVLDLEKYRHRCELNIKVAGQELVVSEETTDMYTAINNAIDKMERNIKRTKEQLKNHKHREE